MRSLGETIVIIAPALHGATSDVIDAISSVLAISYISDTDDVKQMLESEIRDSTAWDNAGDMANEIFDSIVQKY